MTTIRGVVFARAYPNGQSSGHDQLVFPERRRSWVGGLLKRFQKLWLCALSLSILAWVP
jgi:hypothetical protein